MCCSICFCVARFVFVLLVLFLCCGFCFCVARFVFVLWVLFLCCEFCFRVLSISATVNFSFYSEMEQATEQLQTSDTRHMTVIKYLLIH